MSWLQKLLPPKIQRGTGPKKTVPEGLWTKCPACNAVLYSTDLEKNLNVCPKCGDHQRIGARARLDGLLDPDGRFEIGAEVLPVDSLKFKDSKRYPDRLEEAQAATGESDALVVMQGSIKSLGVVCAAFEFEFMGGSMGSVVGERLVRGVHVAVEQKLPLIIVTATGGARMQEGLLSLMQMAKTTAALTELAERGLPFVSVLTDPTMGGVSASFAMIGDIVLAEPKALIGFAGPRVIEQTVRQKLPEGFQRAEFLLEKGAVDMIVDRRQLRDKLHALLALLLGETFRLGLVSGRTLGEWLVHVERQHPKEIALGLERVGEVLARLGVSQACPVITVGGTNGKGSACAMLESILRAAGYRTGLYSSPHLLRYNERVRVAGREADDAALCEAFEAVESARGQVPLTYFEFGTLAAAWLFARERLDALVLEVGLGGRLDAVNAIEPDCALLTSVGVDHVGYLGATREEIGREKAGIFRAGKPAVVAEPEPPASVLEEAARVGAKLLLLGRDFGFSAEAAQWSCWGPGGKRAGLAYPALRGAIQLRNASAVIVTLDALRERLPVGMQEVRRGLAEVNLPGRFQVLPGRPQVVLDVAHNPQAAAVLAANLQASGFAPQTIAVLGMLADKDIDGVVSAVAPRITRWHLATLGGSRGASAHQLAAALAACGVSAPAIEHASVARALAAAQGEAGEGDKIIVFGSFLTVAEAMAQLQAQRRPGHG